MLIVKSLTQPGGRERVTRMNKQSNVHRHKANSNSGKRKKGSQEWANNGMFIDTSVTQSGGREWVTRMNKRSNAHRHKPNSTRGKTKGDKNEQTIECSSSQAKLNQEEEKGSHKWTNDRMLIVTSLTQPGGRERVTRMNKRRNTHRHKPNSTRRKRKSHRNEQTIECSSSKG